MRKHEYIGLGMIFLSGILLGLALYMTFWAAIKPLYYSSLNYLIKWHELLFLMFIYGISFVLGALGKIEIKEALPGSKK
jgi:hypothetical protein